VAALDLYDHDPNADSDPRILIQSWPRWLFPQSLCPEPAVSMIDRVHEPQLVT
jgi:hypothetical protein